MPTAVLTFAFDPLLHIGDTASVRIETVVLAVVFLAGIALAARIGRQTPAPPLAPVADAAARPAPGAPAPGALGAGLRFDDLLFIVVGAIPGAIVGGRLGYVLDHLDFYQANPGLVIDPTQGGFGLTLAVPLGLVTGGLIAWLIGAPVARWMHAVAFPLLFVLAASKLAGLLGASGQGLPSDLPWATAYVGPGPWDSLAANIPSQPSAAYEAILVVAAIGVLARLQQLPVVARRDGGALFLALGLWAVARLAVAFTWRDTPAIGPLRADQVLSLLLLAIAVAGLVERARGPFRRPELGEPDAAGEAAP